MNTWRAMEAHRLRVFFCMLICFSVFLSTGTLANMEDSNVEPTALEKHVGFFDRNKDGIIYPNETYEGFLALGASKALATASAAFINGLLAPKTKKGALPSPLLPIYIENIKKGIHGSHTGAYDEEGRFVPAKFEEIFTKHAKENPNALSSDELKEMLKANQEPKDPKGWLAAKSEWDILLKLFKDKDGLLQKDAVRDLYDGTLFYNKEKEQKSLGKKA